MFRFFKRFSESRIALLIDGPNLLRKEFSIDLNKFRTKTMEHGRIVVARVFLNQFAPVKLVEAVANQGFEPVIGMGGTKEDQTDVDVYLSVAAMDAVYNKNIDVIALGTRDADFLPVVQRAKEMGKKVIIMGQNPGFSKGLQRAADVVVDLREP